jgi:hypothetical protein
MEQLDANKISKPNQKALRLRVNSKEDVKGAPSPRNHKANAAIQARAPAIRHHQAEKPNEK